MKKLLSLSVLIAMLWGCCNVEDTPKTDEKPANYIVTFDANGGSGVMPEQVFVADMPQPLNPNTFKRDGYVFTEWNTTADGKGVTYLSGSYYSLTSDIKLYAQWNAEEEKKEDEENPDNPVEMYTVTFNANDGTEKKSTQIFISEKKQNLNTNYFNYSGYTFTGWNTEAEGNGTAYTDSQVITITSDLTLYAQWKLNESEEDETPNNPTQMYTVTFDANDGTEKKSTQIFISGKSQSLNTNYFYYSGYIFTGWNTEAEGNGTAYTDSQVITITSDLTLYAQWKLNESEEDETPNNPTQMHTVTFNANDGTEKKSTQIFISGKSQSLNTNYFYYSGYIFTGWNTEVAGNGTAYTDSQVITITSDITLYAQWKLNESEEDETPNNPTQMHTVTFNPNGGSGIMSEQSFIDNIPQPLNTNIFKRTGYVFREWNTSPDGNGTTYMPGNYYLLNDNITLYAQWTANTYTVKFNDNSGTGEMQDQVFTYDIEQTLTENTFTREGYSFGGWATNIKGEKVYTDKAMVKNLISDIEGEIILYAVWLELYPITYELNGGTNTNVNPTKYNIETATILANATKIGYTFDGWYIDEACTIAKTEISKGSTGAITLYAKWIANTYTVKFDANGGSGEMENMNFTYDVEQILTSNVFICENYVFAGWATSADGNKIYENKATVRNLTSDTNGEFTLYAIWEAISIGCIAYDDKTISKDYENTKQPIGIVISIVDGKAEKILSISEWYGEWDEMVSACNNYTDASGNSNWYLPNRSELSGIRYKKNDIDIALEKIGKSKLQTYDYWSSTYDYEYDDYAEYIYFGGGYSGDGEDKKYFTKYARAVRLF